VKRYVIALILLFGVAAYAQRAGGPTPPAGGEPQAQPGGGVDAA